MLNLSTPSTWLSRFPAHIFPSPPTGLESLNSNLSQSFHLQMDVGDSKSGEGTDVSGVSEPGSGQSVGGSNSGNDTDQNVGVVTGPSCEHSALTLEQARTSREIRTSSLSLDFRKVSKEPAMSLPERKRAESWDTYGSWKQDPSPAAKLAQEQKQAESWETYGSSTTAPVAIWPRPKSEPEFNVRRTSNTNSPTTLFNSPRSITNSPKIELNIRRNSSFVATGFYRIAGINKSYKKLSKGVSSKGLSSKATVGITPKSRRVSYRGDLHDPKSMLMNRLVRVQLQDTGAYRPLTVTLARIQWDS